MPRGAIDVKKLCTILSMLSLAVLAGACDVPVPGDDPAQPPAASEPVDEATPGATPPAAEDPSAGDGAPAPTAAPSLPPASEPVAPEPADPAPDRAAAQFESSEQWATWNDGDYILYNNIWGSGAGAQSIWANGFSEWGVHADHPDTGGVTSYPNVTRPVNQPLSALSSLTSTFDVTVPDAGAYTSTYDIWADDHSYEIMIWMNQFGPVGPIGAFETSVSVGGHDFDVYRGLNGSFEVFSFLRTSDTDAGAVDVLEIMNWIREQGWFGDVMIGDVQFGDEITSSSGGLDFITNDFSVDFE